MGKECNWLDLRHLAFCIVLSKVLAFVFLLSLSGVVKKKKINLQTCKEYPFIPRLFSVGKYYLLKMHYIGSCCFSHQLVNLNGERQLSVFVSLFPVLSIEKNA